MVSKRKRKYIYHKYLYSTEATYVPVKQKTFYTVVKLLQENDGNCFIDYSVCFTFIVSSYYLILKYAMFDFHLSCYINSVL